MTHPVAVDMTRIAHIVEGGTLRAHLASIVDRYGSGPIDDPGWLTETGYAYAQMRGFRLAVHESHAHGATAQARILWIAKTLLSDRCEWIVDLHRLATIDGQAADGLARCEIAGDGHERGDRFWDMRRDPITGAVQIVPNGQRGDERACGVPRDIVDRFVGPLPIRAHLVRENGNRKINLRYGVDAGSEMDLGREIDPVRRMRLIASMPENGDPAG